MTSLEQDLKAEIIGEVRFDEISRRVYSVDASIYEILPMGIVLPKTREDLIKAITIAQRHGVSLTARGAATGIAGGCIGSGLIIDTSKYLNKIIEINYDQEYVLIEPGVVQDVLNESLKAKGYRLGPDTSTGNRATIGGMTANNSAGARSLRYGKMVDHVESIEMVLANGEVVTFIPCSTEEWKKKCALMTTEGHIYREVSRIREQYHTEIDEHFPKIPRRVSGYNLDELLNPSFNNISKLIVGSEGTLGIITKIKLRIVKRPEITGLVVIHFRHLLEGMNHLSQLLNFHPLSLEMIDHHIIQMGKSSPTMQKKLDWIKENPQAVFVAEFEEKSSDQLARKLHEIDSFIHVNQIGYATVLLTGSEEMNHVWAIRKAGLELLLSKRTYNRAIAFLEDISIPPNRLAGFMEKFIHYLKRIDKQAGIYGHVGSGCMHIRPYMDLRDPSELSLMRQMMNEISSLVLEYGGALSGEHGDGLVRSWLNRKMFGDKVYQAFNELKEAFDPRKLMNPGKIVNGHEFLDSLRLDPSTKIQTINTFLDFSAEGGFTLAADLCNGNGLCRKRENVMCPSFQATGDEYDTTRARAQALRAIVNGHVPKEELASHGLYNVLDLCLECKGCKKECPSHVDMAKMKSEFLYHYQEKWGYSLRSRIFANLGLINSWISPCASLFNYFGKSALVKPFLKWLGISSNRSFPPLAKVRFSYWVRQQPAIEPSDRRVVLFNDTFTEFHCPEVGQAAFRILRHLGYHVIIPDWKCCGRTWLSKGFLQQAKHKAQTLLETFLPYAKESIPIIGLEPSCILTLKDDFKSLLGETQEVKLLTSACQTIDEFLSLQKFNFKETETSNTIFVHGHCHQKALVGTEKTLTVLKKIPNTQVIEINAGCCGMAGSFGYEKEHEDLSLKIGELHLFPSLRKAEPQALIVANGISCRSQIAHGTKRHSKHFVEIIDEFIQKD